MRNHAALASAIVLSALCFLSPGIRAAEKDADFRPLLNGKNLDGWVFRNEAGKGAWKLVGDAKLDPSDPKKLFGTGEGTSTLLRGPIDHGSDLYTKEEVGDVELTVDIMVPKGSNSGVYLMGQYEVQVFDSYGKEKLGTGDMGAIYNTKAPSENASKAPGEWQTLHVVFRAPRFENGKKTENARFVLVELNGKKIQSDVEAPKPTGSELPGGEKAKGPLLLQGDHGIVAFRNLKWKPIAVRR